MGARMGRALAMRILLCLNRDLASNLALNLLWPALKGHAFDLVLSQGVARSAPRAPEIADWQRIEHEIVEGGLFPFLDARGNSVPEVHWTGPSANRPKVQVKPKPRCSKWDLSQARQFGRHVRNE